MNNNKPTSAFEIRSNNKYEYKVKERAAELSELYMGREWCDLSDIGKNLAINDFIDIARLSVQREADSYKEGVNVGMFGYNGVHPQHMNAEDYNHHLIHMGLIPPQTQTT